MTSYITLIAILMFVLFPLFIPIAVTIVHGIRGMDRSDWPSTIRRVLTAQRSVLRSAATYADPLVPARRTQPESA